MRSFFRLVLLGVLVTGCSDDSGRSDGGGTDVSDAADGGGNDASDVSGDSDPSDAGDDADTIEDDAGDGRVGDDVRLADATPDTDDIGDRSDASDLGEADLGDDTGLVDGGIDAADFGADGDLGLPDLADLGDAGVEITAPGVGAVIFSEIMPDPAVLFDEAGEWFELYNTSPTTTYELEGCVFESDGAGDQTFTVMGSLAIAPESYLTFSRGASPGFFVDYTYGDGNISLNNNSADALRLRCDSGAGLALVDAAAYEEAGSFSNRAVSLSVDPSSLAADANDTAADWCASTSVYSPGDEDDDYGSPGTQNDVCRLPATVGWCRLDSPTSITDFDGTTHTVAGHLAIDFWTDQTSGTDAHPLVRGGVGYGTTGSAPNTWADWFEGAADAGWTDTDEPGHDRFEGELILPVAGDYDFAFRFSADGGFNWLYCDGDAGDGMDGSEDGYLSDDAGQLTSEAEEPPAVIIGEYVEGSGWNKAIEIANAGPTVASLSGCVLEKYTDGGTGSTTSLALDATIAIDDVYVICHLDATFDMAECDLETDDPTMAFNGNDALAIVCGEEIVDSLGDTLADPGDQWFSDGVGTQNETLQRDCTVAAGDTNLSDAFDPAAEWDTLTVDTVSGLGSPECCYAAGDDGTSITFVYNDLEDVLLPGETVYLAGDFNAWSSSSTPLTANDDGDVFTVTVDDFSEGLFNYKYIVNDGGDNWDWLNTNNRAYTASCPDETLEDYRNVQIGWANLEEPESLETTVDTPTDTVMGQVYINNVTNPAGEGRGIAAQVGYGSGDDPAAWTWSALDYSSDTGNNDLFAGSFTPSAAGTFHFATRFDGNAGAGNPNAGWTYGDLNGLAVDGFTIDQAGTLTVE